MELNNFLSPVNPVRNSSRCDSKPTVALNPALRGMSPSGAEPSPEGRRPRGPLGFESKRLARREQWGIISNEVKWPHYIKKTTRWQIIQH